MTTRLPTLIGIIVSNALTALPVGAKGDSNYHKQIDPPPRGENASGLIRGAIDEAIATIRDRDLAAGELILAAGDYELDIFPGDEDALIAIHGARNLTVAGVGPSTRLIVRDQTLNIRDSFRKVLSVTDSFNLVMENLAIDFTPEARDWLQGIARNVETVEDGTITFQLQLDADSPPFRPKCFSTTRCFLLGMVQNQFRQPRENFPDHFPCLTIEPEANGELRITTRLEGTDGHDFLNDQRVVIAARKPGEALFCFAGTNHHPVLRQLLIQASRGMLIEAYGCEGLELDRVRLSYGPGQWLVSPGDGIHYQGGISGPDIHDSHFEGLGDDAMNIYAKPFAISSREPGNFRFEDTAAIQSGDQLWIYPANRAWDGALVTIEKTESGQFQTVEKLPEQIWACAVNLSRSGKGFTVRNNSFGPLRGLGCRLQTGNGVVENNTFHRLSGAAVSLECGLASTDTYGLGEGPFPFDITIRNNRFDECASSLGYNRTPIRRVAPWDPSKPHELIFDSIKIESNRTLDKPE